MRRTWYILIAAIAIAFIGGLLLYKYIQSDTSEHAYGYAFIRPEIVEKADSNYPKYLVEKETYDNMKAQYEAEKHMRQWVSGDTQKVALDGSALSASYMKAYRANVAIKEMSNYGRLMEAYNRYVHQYSDVWGLSPSEVDLQIVNLQLQLLSIPFSPKVKEEKEAELKRVLVNRSPNLFINDKALQKKVLEAVAPLKLQLQEELRDYKKKLQAEMTGLRQKQNGLASQFRTYQVQANQNDAWETAWKKKLSLQRERYEGLYELIQQAVRTHSEAVAKEKGLELKKLDTKEKGKALDITDAVVASFK